MDVFSPRLLLGLFARLRFGNSRSVAFYLGLTPRQVQSGDQDPERRIHKAGALRYLLVQCAQRVLGPPSGRTVRTRRSEPSWPWHASSRSCSTGCG
jgi:transposase